MFTEFNIWAATWWPGAKIKFLGWATFLTSLGAASMPFFTDAPWDWKLVVGEYAPYAGMAVGLLAVWFRLLSQRFQEMKDDAMVNVPIVRAVAGDSPRARASARRAYEDTE